MKLRNWFVISNETRLGSVATSPESVLKNAWQVLRLLRKQLAEVPGRLRVVLQARGQARGQVEVVDAAQGVECKGDLVLVLREGSVPRRQVLVARRRHPEVHGRRIARRILRVGDRRGRRRCVGI